MAFLPYKGYHVGGLMQRGSPEDVWKFDATSEWVGHRKVDL